MASCQCQGIENIFSDAYAARELARYRRKGASRTTRMLVDALISEDIAGGSLLDIGGGVGAIPHLLLQAGMRTATSVEASPGYAAAAAGEARRRGLTERVNPLQGNFVELAPQIEAHDVVTLVRVICCYDDMEGLVRASGAKAGRLYGLVYPRESRLARLAVWMLNGLMRLCRSRFRNYVHSTERLDALLDPLGFTQQFFGRTLFWQVRVYRRQPTHARSGSVPIQPLAR